MNKKITLALLVLMALAAAFRLVGIERASLWLDEAYSAWFAGQSLTTLWTEVPFYETHPPLYYSILHFWVRLVGTSELALRGLSVIFSAATVPLVFALGYVASPERKKLTVGFMAAGILAFCPLAVHYGREARPYAMLTFFAALFLVCLVRLLQDHRTKTLQGKQRILLWLGLIASGALCCWLHNVVVLTLPAVFLCLFLLYTPNLQKHLPLRRLFLAGLAIFALWAPYLPWYIRQSSIVAQDFWAAPLSLRSLVYSFTYLFGIPGFDIHKVALFGLPNIPLDLPLELALVCLALAGALYLHKHSSKLTATTLVIWAFVPFAVLVLVSVLVRPILLPRTIQWSVPAYCVLLASGLAYIPSKFWRLGILSLLGLIFLWTRIHSPNIFGPEEPWQKTAAFIQANILPEESVWLYPNYAELPFDYYFAHPERSHGLPYSFPAFREHADYAKTEAAPPMTSADIQRISISLAEQKGVWLVIREGNYDDSAELLGNKLNAKMTLQDVRRYAMLCIYHFLRNKTDTPVIDVDAP